MEKARDAILQTGGGNMSDIKMDVLQLYPIGEVRQIDSISGGIINDSWRVRTESGHYILQRLSDRAFDERVIADQWQVLDWLHRRNFRWAPRLILTARREKFVRQDGRIWRLMAYIDHDPIATRTDEKILAATAVLAEFHRAMKDCPYDPIYKIKDFHDSPVIWENLGEMAFGQDRDDIVKSMTDEVIYLHEVMPSYFLPNDLPETLIHGDPRFDNFLFRGEEVAALIDFDTVMRANELIDIGDFCRSMCRRETLFNQELFDKIITQYLSINHRYYIAALAKQATALITLELSARFFMDCFSPPGQEYFGWDAEKYLTARDHNLARGKMYLEYFWNIIKNSL